MHLAIARSFADFCLSRGIDHDYTQWFPGKENTVADILSRDFALSDKEVTKLIRRHCSPLVPQSFRIIPLPGTIISRIGELLRRFLSTKLLPTRPMPRAIAAGAAFECFLELIGGQLDPFLRQLGRQEKFETFACFAAAHREGRLDARRASTASLGRNCSCHPRRCGSGLSA